jgi:hypothetical protein
MMDAARADHAQQSDGSRADLSRQTNEITQELVSLTVVNLITDERFERHRLIPWLRSPS